MILYIKLFVHFLKFAFKKNLIILYQHFIYLCTEYVQSYKKIYQSYASQSFGFVFGYDYCHYCNNRDCMFSFYRKMVTVSFFLFYYRDNGHRWVWRHGSSHSLRENIGYNLWVYGSSSFCMTHVNCLTMKISKNDKREYSWISKRNKRSTERSE